MKYRFLFIKTWFRINLKRFFNTLLPKHLDYIKFAIVCSPRTGSTLLHTYLNSHTSVLSYGEALRRNIENGISNDIIGQVFKPHGSNIKAVGLKIFMDYKEESNFKAYYQQVVQDTSVKIILLQRVNLKRQYYSLKLAESTQLWTASSKRPSSTNITIDEKEFVMFKNRLNDQEQDIMNDFKHHDLMTLTYEQLTKTKEESLDKIQRFLHVKRRRLWTVLKKQSR
jgi:LPS sulfotransferase NodH